MNIKSKHKPYLSVVIPAYNEQEVIGSTLENVLEYLEGQSFGYEVVVVNDGSTDGTADIVSEFIPANSRIKLLNTEKNSGKGWTVKMGMLEAAGRYRLFMDADNSTSIDHFELMKPILQSGAGIIIGSRRVKGGKIAVHQHWIRENLGRVFNLAVRIINGLPYSDTQAGFKLFSGNAADKIFDLQTLPGWAFDIEILLIARALGYEVRQIPITWKNHSDSRVRFSGMIKMLIDLFKLRIIRCCRS
ncbi:MAG: glycosyltransferase family 2 protein [Candidatus Dadabacteria bacterium]|nr:glycosyltransferase family 2 protein [Candidatus Dadabacteria bacterium]NIS08043.1 glycosyltransferase family 2 protein [Candidatus Dadabacteria bacterium]NIV40866.1 glycosyltransferase [Candidatus Dadabacteria bacterium]NIY21621.1 glycosyltransferase [Candidatus Dadabacteria bacterium]